MTEYLEPMVRRSIHMATSDYDQVKELANKYGMSPSAVIRLALQLGLEDIPLHFRQLASARRKVLNATVKGTIEHLKTLTPGGQKLIDILPGKESDHE